MLSRITRLLFVVWFLILAALVRRGLQGGWTAGVWSGLFVLILLHPTLIATELVLSRVIGRRSRTVRISLPVLLSAWFGEWVASTIVFGWRLPWRAASIEDHLPNTSRGLRGVVFIHGLICNRGLWNPWLARLRKLDRAFVAVSLEPVFGDIEAYVADVERAVRRVEAVTGLAPIVVAHSMGGLVARAWLRTRRPRGPDGTQNDVARVITIATPHRGTWLAHLSMSRSGAQMRPGSDWMSALADAESPTLAECFTCWWSECDQVVFPPPVAVLPGSESRQLHGVAHVAMAGREEIWAELRRRIDD